MSDIFEKEKRLFLNTYNRIPIEVDHGEGVYLVDKKGNKYLDFFSGLAVNALGYAHPAVVKAVSEQISKFGHLSNNFITDVQIEFAELLIKHSGMSKVFLTNSGTEAIEGAIKIIRKKYGPEKKIISLTNSFHGRTYGALSLTMRAKYRNGFEPLLPNITHVKYNDTDDLESQIDENTAAVFLEFLQGEGGINLISKKFVEKLDELRSGFEFAVVSDAIQCGIGRTGKPFSHDHFRFEPDIICTAKAIGGGLPLGAILVNRNFSDIFTPGLHGTTFGGNPVCCAAGFVVLREVFENGLMKKVDELGNNYFFSGLKKLKEDYPSEIKEIRGLGFMIGIDLFYDGNEIVDQMRKRNILINCTNQSVLRILPPLITTKNEIDIFLGNLDELFREKTV